MEIYLPQTRIAASRGLWLDRLPVDDLDQAIQNGAGRTAFVGWNSAQGREIRLSYAELGERADQIALGLLDCGVGKGDVVAFQLPNWWEFTALFYACCRIGAVANPLMPIFRQRELRFMLGFAETRVVIAPSVFRGFDHGAMLLEMQAELPALKHVLLIGGEGKHSFEQVLERSEPMPSADVAHLFVKLRPGPD